MNAYKKLIVEKSYCIFIDILGYSKSICEEDDKGTSEEHLAKLDKAMKEAMQELKICEEYSFKIFTDNIVIGIPFKQFTKYKGYIDENELDAYSSYGSGDIQSEIYYDYFKEIISAISCYQLKMTLANFFIRGGWDYGNLYINNQFVYGKALITSYKLENELAIYPRIIISNHIKSMIDRFIYNKKYLVPFFHKEDFLYGHFFTLPFLLKDESNNYFVNYLYSTYDTTKKEYNGTLIFEHKKIILEKLKIHSKDNRVKQKYLWLAFYHNTFCKLFISKVHNDISSLLIETQEIDLNWKIDFINE